MEHKGGYCKKDPLELVDFANAIKHIPTDLFTSQRIATENTEFSDIK